MITKRQIRVTTGSEGPSHDPYSYTEIEIITNDTVVVGHFGLAEWVTTYKVGERKPPHESFMEDAENLFEKWTGMHFADAERYHDRYQNTCKTCGCRRVVPVGSGYVGETIYGCARCNRMMYTDFRMDMIE